MEIEIGFKGWHGAAAYAAKLNFCGAQRPI
jgi:hypothetical protein